MGSTSGGAAFDIADGKALWLPKPDDTCYDAGYGGGPKLVALRKCGQYGQRQLHVQTLDPKSGKVISDYKMSEGIEYAAIVSTDPLVVAADVGDSAGDGSGISDFFSVDNKTGKLRATSPRPATSTRPAATASPGSSSAPASRSATTGSTSRPSSTTAAASTARPTRSSPSTSPPAARPASARTPATASRSTRCAWTAAT